MPESNSAVVLLVSVKSWLTCDRWASLFFCTKILKEGPYLKSFIIRVRSKHRERFSSISRYGTRSRTVPYYLTVLHRTVRTKAVKVLYSRVLCLYHERFRSFSRYGTCFRVEPFFLTALHRVVCTKAVKLLPISFMYCSTFIVVCVCCNLWFGSLVMQ